MSREIPLTRGLVAVVDDEDYDLVAAFKWYANPCGNTIYAEHKSRKHGSLSMHRLIMSAPSGKMVDHWDGDGLNNRRSNLRFATRRQNQFNRSARKDGASGYKGVIRSSNETWAVHVGGFENEEDAALAANLIMPLAHGEFARLNVVEG